MASSKTMLTSVGSLKAGSSSGRCIQLGQDNVMMFLEQTCERSKLVVQLKVVLQLQSAGKQHVNSRRCVCQRYGFFGGHKVKHSVCSATRIVKLKQRLP
mmetsp:Transcript_62068/g.115170  ORF Transcript_62068/g.115170 Transcript_62068/m.115170 type:complete len:99 (-) Transcript_62068:71-367(-)